MLLRAAGLLLLSTLWMPTFSHAQDPFGQCAKDGESNATIIIPETALVTKDGSPVSHGSRIAAVTQDGICAGTVVWNGTASAFAVWADDPMNPEKDGADVDEYLTFQIWDADTRREFAAVAELSDGFTFEGSSGKFNTDAVFILQSLQAQAFDSNDEDDTQPHSLEIRLSEGYPNPFSASTTIPFEVPESLPVVLEVFNTAGARVATLLDGAVLRGHQEARWAPENLPSGLYVIRLRVGDTVRTGSIIHVD